MRKQLQVTKLPVPRRVCRDEKKGNTSQNLSHHSRHFRSVILSLESCLGGWVSERKSETGHHSIYRGLDDLKVNRILAVYPLWMSWIVSIPRVFCPYLQNPM